MIQKVFLTLLVLIHFQLELSAQMVSVCADTTTANRTVLQAAISQQGKKVARGECWDLIQFSLNFAHVKWDGFQLFGTPIPFKTACLQVGDVLQFEHVYFAGILSNGMEYWERYEHHFAIIHAVHQDGMIELIHQNTGQFGKVVGISMIQLKDLKTGEISCFRPTFN